MMMRTYLSLLWVVVTLCTCVRVSFGNETFEEFVWIKRLASKHVHTRLEFLIERDKGQNDNHTVLFPRTLLEILTAHKVEELHFSLTQGHWRLESWGDPQGGMTPTGAHLVAWFGGRKEDADENWRGFANRMSGLSCASLNFLDETTSIEPMFAYRPLGKIRKDANVRVGALPREFICTENLTPWTKLLPCGIMRGLASLLRSKQVFNTHYHSAEMRYIRRERGVELRLSLSLVVDNPAQTGHYDNFVKNVIGSVAIFPCHPSKGATVRLWDKGAWRTIPYEELNSLKVKDIPDDDTTKEKNLVFTPTKYMGGYGQEYGKMVVEMTNHLTDRFLSVLYVEVLPWYIRPYLHTLTAQVIHGDQRGRLPNGRYFHYTPGRDRKALHKLEMDLQIPPSSKVTLSFMVEKGHLKWDEYPPDANHGFYLEAAHFEVNVTGKEESEARHYYSRVLLINLSTPDFSMPYNVICLTCTVVALAFGPIHNITTKRLQLREITPRGEKLKGYWNKLKEKLKKKKPEDEDKDSRKKESESKTANPAIEAEADR